LLEPARFLAWFEAQRPELVASNAIGGTMTSWVYKLTYDTGAAPHVQNGLLSLAICKPKIRLGAVPGDVIFGFGGRSFPVIRGARLIYVAQVTSKLRARRVLRAAAVPG
jgi:hypothetical protein